MPINKKNPFAFKAKQTDKKKQVENVWENRALKKRITN